MSEPEIQRLLQELASVRAVLEEMKAQQDRERDEWRQDKAEIWAAIGQTNRNVQAVSESIAVGRGGIRVVAWVGGLIVSIGLLVMAILTYIKH